MAYAQAVASCTVRPCHLVCPAASGPRALALIGVLATRHHLTQFKIRDLLAQMTGLDFSVGAISQAHGKLAQALKAPVEEATRTLAQAPLVHMDETRYPREGSAN